jgi:hypothetical protein
MRSLLPNAIVCIIPWIEKGKQPSDRQAAEHKEFSSEIENQAPFFPVFDYASKKSF